MEKSKERKTSAGVGEQAINSRLADKLLPILIVLGALAAATGTFMHSLPDAVSPAAKTSGAYLKIILPLIAAGAVLFRLTRLPARERGQRLPVLPAFLLCATGDFLLAAVEGGFIAGIGCYLAAYSIFTLVILGITRVHAPFKAAPFGFVALFAVLASLLQLALFIPLPKDLVVPIYIYGVFQGLFLGTGIYSAWKALQHRDKRRILPWLPALGMILTYISDTLIAYHLFAIPLPFNGEPFIQGTYIPALVFMGLYFSAEVPEP